MHELKIFSMILELVIHCVLQCLKTKKAKTSGMVLKSVKGKTFYHNSSTKGGELYEVTDSSAQSNGGVVQIYFRVHGLWGYQPHPSSYPRTVLLVWSPTQPSVSAQSLALQVSGILFIRSLAAVWNLSSGSTVDP